MRLPRASIPRAAGPSRPAPARAMQAVAGLVVAAAIAGCADGPDGRLAPGVYPAAAPATVQAACRRMAERMEMQFLSYGDLRALGDGRYELALRVRDREGIVDRTCFFDDRSKNAGIR